ncbi:MAG: hypothetical protein WBP13_09020 [Methylophilaceae bacterium]
MTLPEALYIGIDVSKANLDINVYPRAHPACFNYDGQDAGNLLAY